MKEQHSPAWRLPQKSPGVAGTPDGFPFPAPGDVLQRDSLIFYAEAVAVERSMAEDPRAKVLLDDQRNRLVRSGIVAAVSGWEARVTTACFLQVGTHGDELDPFVREVLEDVETSLDEHGRVRTRRRKLGSLPRFYFLVAFLSGKEFPRGDKVAQQLQEAIRIRDAAVHLQYPFTEKFTASKLALVIDAISAADDEVQRMIGGNIMPDNFTASEWLYKIDPEHEGEYFIHRGNPPQEGGYVFPDPLPTPPTDLAPWPGATREQD